MKKEVFSALKNSMEEGLGLAKGKKIRHSRITEYVVRKPKMYTAKQIKKIRKKRGLSQLVFCQYSWSQCQCL